MNREDALREAQHVTALINAYMQRVPLPTNSLYGSTVEELTRLGGVVAPHSFYYLAQMQSGDTRHPVPLEFLFEPDRDQVDLANIYHFSQRELSPDQTSQEGGAK